MSSSRKKPPCNPSAKNHMTEPVVISQLPIKQAQKPPKETNGYKNIFHYSTYGSVIAARTEGGGNTGQLSPQKKKKKVVLALL
jgi:hypothetical protein